MILQTGQKVRRVIAGGIGHHDRRPLVIENHVRNGPLRLLLNQMYISEDQPGLFQEPVKQSHVSLVYRMRLMAVGHASRTMFLIQTFCCMTPTPFIDSRITMSGSRSMC